MRLITRCATLCELYEEAAATWPDKIIEFRGTKHRLTYAGLVQRAQHIAGGLQARGVEPGSLIGLIQGNDPGFLLSFMAVSFAGCVPTPLPVPISVSGISAFLQRIHTIIKDAGISNILVSDFYAEQFSRKESQVNGLFDEVTTLTCTALEDDGVPFVRADIDAESLALVQYTSGSTSAPKGVALRHRQVVASIDAIGLGIQLGPSDVNGQWLPLFHDMGLIGTLTGIAHGTSHHFWQPAQFIRRPARFLREYAEVGGTIYAGPNFSYSYLLDSITAEKAADLDLSRWRIAFNGAESIDPHVMNAFIERFSSAGFRASTMFPVYGLAEATLAVTFPSLGDEPTTLWIERDALAHDGQVTPLPATDVRARGVVSVGFPVKGQELRIVDDDGKPLPSDHVGEIEIRGTAVMDGYYRRIESANDEATPAAWHPTGDLGFLSQGRLYVTGRRKQMLIVRGQNYYPEDIEWKVATTTGVYQGRNVAVLGADESGQDNVCVIAETTVRDPDALQTLCHTILSDIKTSLGISPGDILLVRKRTIRRTTNGKYQRVLMGRLLRDGDLEDAILHRLSSNSTSNIGAHVAKL